MLKEETLAKVKTLARDVIAEITEQLANGASVEMSFSTGNEKIGRTLNVSTMPGFTCRNFSVCEKICYAMKIAAYRPSCIKAWAKNTAVLLYSREEFFRQIDAKMSRRRKNKYFRWHVAGDIPDYDYFRRMVEIARRHPDFRIWTYTKDYWFVNRYVREHGGTRADAIPENFSIMFSTWPGVRLKNPYGFPVFNFVPKGATEFPDIPFCPGNCDICKNGCAGCIGGQSRNVREHG